MNVCDSTAGHSPSDGVAGEGKEDNQVLHLDWSVNDGVLCWKAEREDVGGVATGVYERNAS